MPKTSTLFYRVGCTQGDHRCGLGANSGCPYCFPSLVLNSIVLAKSLAIFLSISFSKIKMAYND